MFNSRILSGISIALFSAIFALPAAASTYEEDATCFTFNKTNKLLSKGSCKVSTTFGAGGSENLIKFKGKRYKFVNVDRFDENGNMLPSRTAYMRDVRNFKIPASEKEAANLPFEKTLFCDKTKSLDVCYLPKQ